MDSILEALADNRLVVNFEGLEETAQYQNLKEQMDAAIKKWSGLVGEEKQILFEELLSLLKETHDFYARESFLYGFRLGGMLMVEVYTNQALLTVPEGMPGRAPDLEALNQSVLKSLSENEINTANPDPSKGQSIRDILQEVEKHEKAIFGGLADGPRQEMKFDDEIYPIDGDILEMKKTIRFIYGYSLGALMITELFAGRDAILKKPGFYKFPEK